MHPNTKKPPRSGMLATSACFALLATSSPSACLQVYSSDVSPANATVDGGPAIGSWDNPQLVTRDNLALGGEMDITDPTVSASVSSPFLSNGTWKSMTGHFTVDEMRPTTVGPFSLAVSPYHEPNYWHYTYQKTPLLPDQAFTGPGTIKYGTRSITMVHGNRYGLSMSGRDNGGDTYSIDNTAFVKLSPDTLVVPVVIISWKKPTDSSYIFADQTFQARNMFDFNPMNTSAPMAYTRPDGTVMSPQPLLAQSPLSSTNVDSPDSRYFTNMAPDYAEIPPDEIWSQCGIQFQVIAQYVADLPSDWKNHCTRVTLNFPQPEDVVRSKLANYPALRDYIVNSLMPVYISYGDLKECNVGGGFTGTTPYHNGHIEVANSRRHSITAHELGHALNLQHAEDMNIDVTNNVMRSDPDVYGDTYLTSAQCALARHQAELFSVRYDQFNVNIGRVYSPTPPPPPSQTPPTYTGIEDAGPIAFSGSSAICCQGSTDIYESSSGSCSGTDPVVSDSLCANVCCYVGTSVTKESQYLCNQQGGTGNICPPS